MKYKYLKLQTIMMEIYTDLYLPKIYIKIAKNNQKLNCQFKSNKTLKLKEDRDLKLNI